MPSLKIHEVDINIFCFTVVGPDEEVSIVGVNVDMPVAAKVRATMTDWKSGLNI
jgi:hypothetical protein